MSDRGFPILPDDEITTGDNGRVVVQFPDGTQTVIDENQTWSLREYPATISTQNISLDVDPRWYYASFEDARSSLESRLPQHTIFDAYTRSSNGSIVARIPREISLDIDKPTEIDFQQYFPTDTVSQVEIFKLSSSEWRRVNATKIAFEMQKQKTEILVRVTVGGFVRDYTTTLVTKIPKLAIDTIDASKNVSGTLSSTVVSPVGIQSFIAGKSWTLNF